MTFDEYQKQAAKTDLFGGGRHDVTEPAFLEKLLGLVGEAGETADKIKKVIRDENGQLSDDKRDAIIKELGDVLWYVAMLGEYLGVSFDEVAERNVAKLARRQQDGTLSGAGDNR